MMILRNVLLGVMILCAQFALASDAFGQTHEGDWYCNDCSFGSTGTPATPETRAFIGMMVNPSVNTWMDVPAMTAHTVTICNGSTCALYTYTGGGAFIQVGPEYPDTHDQEDYENSEDAPADPPSGGGSGGGGNYYWLGSRLYNSGTCIYGCGTGKVEVGEVDPQ